jgi:hypothetical protein
MRFTTLSVITDYQIEGIAEQVEREREPEDQETDEPFFSLTVQELRRFGEILIEAIAKGGN